MKKSRFLAGLCALVMALGMITVPAIAVTTEKNGEIIVYAVNEDGKTYNSAFTKTGTWAIGSYTVGNRVSGYSKSAATFSFDMGTVAAGHYKAYYYSFKNAVSTDMSVKVGGAVAAEITLPNPGNTDSIADGWAMIGEITLKEAAKVTIDGSAAARNLRAGAVKLVPVAEDPEGTVIAYVTDEEGNLSSNITISPTEILEYSATNIELGWTWSNSILVDGRKTITTSAPGANFEITFEQAYLQRGKYQIQYYNYAQSTAGTIEMLLSVKEGEQAIGEFVKPVVSRTLNQNVLIEEWTPIGEIVLNGTEDVTVSYVNTSGKDNARATAVKLVPMEIAANSFKGYVNDYSVDNLADHEVVSGSWSIADGKLSTTATGTNLLSDTIQGLPGNYEVSAEMTYTGTPAGGSAGIVFGATDNKNFYHWRVAFNASGGQLLQFYEFKNGTSTKLYEVGYKWYTEGNSNILSARVEGNVITLCLDGETRVTYEAEMSMGTGVGFRAYKCGIEAEELSVMPVEGIKTLSENAIILDNEDQAYTESGSFGAAEGILGRDGSAVRCGTANTSIAIWGSYPQKTENYDIYYYNPAPQTEALTLSVATLDGYWRKVVSPVLLERAGWIKLVTVAATENTAVSAELTGKSGFYADAIALVPTVAPVSSQYSPVDGGADTVAVLVNQLGYDHGSAMRATVPNAEDGAVYKVLRQSDGVVIYEGAVEGNIVDFSGKLPEGADTDYYIVCGEAKSYVFTVGENLIYRRSVENALKFMAESRNDTFLESQHGNVWRDGPQYAFELNGLVLQYMANPSYYENMDLEICNAEACKYEELRVQDEPAIVWLMQFAALRCYELGQEYSLHALTKEQLAYFLYVYPEISDYVSRETYEMIRDYTISVWGVDECDSVGIYNSPEGTVHDLYALQTVFGGFKGAQPPAHSIVPNLFMYEIALRDGLGTEAAEKFFTAAYENCAWLIGDEFDLNDPFYNKGQRMSEHITIPALCYFLEEYPARAPEGLKEAIAEWAEVTIARADNQWDMRMAVSVAAGDGQYTFHNPEKASEQLTQDYWTGAAYAAADEQGNYLSGGVPKNEPGNAAGLQAVTYAAARVLEDVETTDRLKAVGVAAIDDIFGRNPSGRAAFYHFTRDFEGADMGWYKQYQGGAGLLEGCTAVLDGNAPEGCYPYNPSAYNTGYTEGWVNYNAAWNVSIAYLAADACFLAISAENGKVGDTITVTLNAPLNTDSAKQEQGEVQVILADGTRTSLTVLEVGTDSAVFTGTYTLPQAEEVEISYGSGLFKNACIVAVETDEEGDLDGNGTTDTADVVFLLQYLVNKEVDLPAEADLNGDGRISIYDAVLLLQQIAQ